MVWTEFWDMHSGGGLKIDPYHYIYVEAPEKEAIETFKDKLGQDPTDTCCDTCGSNYSIDEDPSLKQATGYHRNCRVLETPRDPKTGLYLNNDQILQAHCYLEAGESPPEGYKVDSDRIKFGEYQTLEEYMKREDVLVIHANGKSNHPLK